MKNFFQLPNQWLIFLDKCSIFWKIKRNRIIVISVSASLLLAVLFSAFLVFPTRSNHSTGANQDFKSTKLSVEEANELRQQGKLKVIKIDNTKQGKPDISSGE